MKIIREIIIILLFLGLGELTSYLAPFPLPGTIMGMIYLFLALYFKWLNLSSIETVSNVVLKHIALFFIPAGVNILANLELISKNLAGILIIVIGSTVIVMVSAGLWTQFFIEGEKE